jgi:hypothetical protein
MSRTSDETLLRMRYANSLIRRGIQCVLLALLVMSAGGCALLGGSPSKANIELRKKTEVLARRVAELERLNSAQAQVIKGLRERMGSLPTLPATRLSRLFTTHGLKFGQLTGGWDRDLKNPGDEGIKVYVVPTDEDGQAIKATGAFKIELFDLADSSRPLVGQWSFDVVAARKAWRGNFLDYEYVLECPWQERVPGHSELTLKVEFLDELTQTPFHSQQVIVVNLLPTTQPVTRPAPVPTPPINSNGR